MHAVLEQTETTRNPLLSVVTLHSENHWWNEMETVQKQAVLEFYLLVFNFRRAEVKIRVSVDHPGVPSGDMPASIHCKT